MESPQMIKNPEFGSMSFSHKATQPFGEFLSDDYRKVDSMMQRAKSITMLKYNDQKERLKLQ
jgi:hypothetical protein